jgi:drug/metabolite transporter (DMT)-like permease
MSTGILLGLLTALCWGSADLCARFATHRIGTLRTMFYMQLCGFFLLTLALPSLGGWGPLFQANSQRAWMFGILAGLLNTVSTLSLYRSFEIGKLSVVAPISASYPVLTMLLSAFTGERLTALRLVGLLLAILGVVIVSRGETSPVEPGDSGQAGTEASPAPKSPNRGVGWAILSALGFGVMFWLLGLRVIPLLGSAPAVWIIRLVSFSTAGLFIALTRNSIALPGRRNSPWILGIAFLDTSAYVFNNYGMQREQTSVVSVLASLYGAVTVALAASLLREPVSKLQWLGIASIFAGIILITR